MISTIDQSAGGCNVVFKELKVCDKTFEAIHFLKPDFSFSNISRRVICFCSIVKV